MSTRREYSRDLRQTTLKGAFGTGVPAFSSNRQGSVAYGDALVDRVKGTTSFRRVRNVVQALRISFRRLDVNHLRSRKPAIFAVVEKDGQAAETEDLPGSDLPNGDRPRSQFQHFTQKMVNRLKLADYEVEMKLFFQVQVLA